MGCHKLALIWTSAGVLTVLSSTAWAQGTIAGVVKDSSGAVLPGVGVEASSEALIERIRTAVTDGSGIYQIIDLRPGTYTVVFSLPGFTSVKREGIVLQGSFTASVDVEMALGAVNETVTVRAESPTVDIQGTVQQTVLGSEFREALPAGRSVQMMAQTLPGIVPGTGAGRPSGQDVGGVSAERNALWVHGGGGFRLEVDGIPAHINQGNGGFSYTLNPGEAQEFVYETSGIGVDSPYGGVRVGIIPKEGGNRFNASFLASYANDHFVSDNLTQDLIEQGLPAANEVLKVYDYSASVGGPIRRDTLWFFTSFRYWGQRERIPGMYRELDPLSFTFDPRLGAAGNADLSRPVDYDSWLTSASLRLTWQASPRNKFMFATTQQPRRQQLNLNATRTLEASSDSYLKRVQLSQVSWKSPLSSRTLIEAAFGRPDSVNPNNPTLPGLDQLAAARDTGTGYTFRSSPTYGSSTFWSPFGKAAISFVTGAHHLKAGFDYGWGGQRSDVSVGTGLLYTLRNEVPQQITITALPYESATLYKSSGLYAQEQWTVNRLTVTAGLRYDWTEGHIPAQASGPGAYSPLVTYAAVDNVPNWKDVNPRFGVAVDLFGNGKTALKATLGRYAKNGGVTGTIGPTGSVNPLTANASANRTWNDANRDYVPQESELGPLSNRNFASDVLTIRVDGSYGQGWGLRDYNWASSVSVEHQLSSTLSVHLGYFHRSFGNFAVTDNLAVTPDDYDEFCIAAPVDERLPTSVSGSQMCGLYDLKPAKRGLVDNVITATSNYGERTATFDGVDAGFDLRWRRVRLTGGLSTGDGFTPSDSQNPKNSGSACFVVDSPQALRFCDTSYPWHTAYKLAGILGAPWGIDLGLSFQSNPGPEIVANYAIPNSEAMAALGRAPSTSQTILLYAEGTLYVANMEQLDLRVTKQFRLRGMRVVASVAIGNVLNDNDVLALNTTYGPNWQAPNYILPGRIFRPQVELHF